MLLNIIVNGYSVVLAIISTVILCRRYGKEQIRWRTREVKSNVVYQISLILVLTVILTFQFNYISQKTDDFVYLVIKWSTLFWGCYILAWIDYKEKIIPNKIILGLGLIRIIFLAYELIINFELWKRVLVYPILGAFIGALVMGLPLLVSRKTIGMGDVKLFFIIGAYVGSTEIFSVMMYSFFISAVVSLALLILKRVKLKGSLPLAPFAFLGVAAEYIFLMLGGGSV